MRSSLVIGCLCALASTVSWLAPAVAADPPKVTRAWSSTVSATEATLSMQVDNLPLATTVYVVYGTDATLATGTTIGKKTVGPYSTGLQTHPEARGLKPSTRYYFRAFASNANGSSSSGIASFVTLALTPPQVTALTVSVVKPTTALASITVNAMNKSSNAHVQWSTDPMLAGAARSAGQSLSPSAVRQVHEDMTGLAPATTYYYRGVISNPEGTGYSAIQSFRTLPGTIATPPSAVTIAMVLGAYRHDPVQNTWHTGRIVQQGNALRWVNDAGVSWSLTPDFANNRLITGTDNPYHARYPNLREFKLIVGNGRVAGFSFGGVYSRR